MTDALSVWDLRSVISYKMAEEASKEVQNFQTVTNIRKITHDALAPVIKK